MRYLNILVVGFSICFLLGCVEDGAYHCSNRGMYDETDGNVPNALQGTRILPRKTATPTSYQRIGGTVFGSDGSSYQQIGNTTFGSDGSTYQRIGNSTFGNDGSSYQLIGNTTFGSDGTVLPQTELEFPIACVSITPSEGGFHGHSPERIELTGA